MRFFVRTAVPRPLGTCMARRNAIHALAPALAALASYEPKTIAVEAWTIVRSECGAISGGVAGNVIPDAAAMRELPFCPG